MLDTLVRPTYVEETWLHSIGFINVLTSHEVTDYRTAETGLLASHLTDGEFLHILLVEVLTGLVP